MISSSRDLSYMVYILFKRKRFDSNLSAGKSFFAMKIPRLPLPALKDSCERYLRAVQPLLENSRERGDTEQCVREMERHVKLQSLLQEYDVQGEVMEDRGYARNSFIESIWDDGELLISLCLLNAVLCIIQTPLRHHIHISLSYTLFVMTIN